MVFDFLSEVVSEARIDEELRARQAPLEELAALARARSDRRDFRAALGGGRGEARLIAEVKRRSPSRGPIRPALDPAALALAYEQGGAVAVSVLTERRRFGGSVEDLMRARQSCSLPILRKDFLVGPFGVVDAAARGADAVLLIAAAAPLPVLDSCLDAARRVGLETLFEITDEEDLEKALRLAPPIVGVNARDLRTLVLHPERHERLRDRLPHGCLAVAESGVRSREDVERLAAMGYDAVLVGEALSAAEDAFGAVRELLGGGRERRR